jgi:hypothetical protein
MPTNFVPWVLRRTLPTCGTERNAEYVTGTGIVETMELIAWLGMFDPQPGLSDMAVIKSIIIWCIDSDSRQLHNYFELGVTKEVCS